MVVSSLPVVGAADLGISGPLSDISQRQVSRTAFTGE
jgi:hypothetical protein